MNACRQQGAALVVGLVVLLVMTMLGISGMSATTSQLRMANNLQTHQVAFQATETISAFFEGDIGDKKYNGVDFDDIHEWNEVPLIFTNLDPAGDGSASTDLNVIYVGCNRVATDESLTYDTQSGESGAGAMMHDLIIVSTALNSSGDSIGQKNNRVNGVQTKGADCPATP